jgi:hypothetical protein
LQPGREIRGFSGHHASRANLAILQITDHNLTRGNPDPGG